MNLEEEQKKLSELQIENDHAQKDYRLKQARDDVREDGSARQDALHEQILRNSRERANEAQQAVARQEKIVSELLERATT